MPLPDWFWQPEDAIEVERPKPLPGGEAFKFPMERKVFLSRDPYDGSWFLQQVADVSP